MTITNEEKLLCDLDNIDNKVEIHTKTKLSQIEQYNNYINAQYNNYIRTLYGIGREDFTSSGEFILLIESPAKRFSWLRTLIFIVIYFLYNALTIYFFPHAGWKAFIFCISGFLSSLFVMGVNPKKEWLAQIFYEDDR